MMESRPKNIRKPIVNLSAVDVVKFLTQDNERLDNLIILDSNNVHLHTTDGILHAAILSVKKEELKLNKLAKLFEVVHVHHGKKALMTHEMVEKVRNKAFAQKDEDTEKSVTGKDTWRA